MYIKLMTNPETKDFIQDPQFLKKIQLCMQNPAMLNVFMQQDPKIKKAFEVLSKDTNPTNMDDIKNAFAGQ